MGFTVKVKVKLSLCLTKHHVMKTYSGSGDRTSRVRSSDKSSQEGLRSKTDKGTKLR